MGIVTSPDGLHSVTGNGETFNHMIINIGMIIIIVADIPGILPGAHRNVGLGLSFLRHIERCRVLLMCLDALAQTSTLYEQFNALQYELEQYDKDDNLVTKPSAVIVNKLDEADLHAVTELKTQLQSQCPVIPISALKQWNIAYVREVILALCK